jgi:murein DD-endopeptidase MepM/ murein hydrolase activator NlpD
MQNRRYVVFKLLIFILVPLALFSCRPEQAVGAILQTSMPTLVAPEITPSIGVVSGESNSPAPTESPTVTIIPSSTPLPVPSRLPLVTPKLTSTSKAMSTPTATSSPTPNSASGVTATALAAADTVDRTCPEPPPAKPDYAHYYLSGERWLTAEETVETHFWLAKPLPGGGRLLYTEWFPYGYDAGGRYLLHTGIDAAEPLGTEILAAADGTVVVAGDDFSKLYGWRCDWYGHLVVIELDRRWRDQPVFVLYGHVLNIVVEPGQHVERGQMLAEVGVGGAAKLPHLHFEVRVGTNEFRSTRNPLLWLEPPPTRGMISGRLVDPEGRPWQGVAVTAVGRSEGTENHTTWTYLDDPSHLIRPDDSLGENFVIGDLLPGKYELYIDLQGQVYQQEVEVLAGELTISEIVTMPYKTATPVPVETVTITTTPTPEQ